MSGSVGNRKGRLARLARQPCCVYLAFSGTMLYFLFSIIISILSIFSILYYPALSARSLLCLLFSSDTVPLCYLNNARKNWPIERAACGLGAAICRTRAAIRRLEVCRRIPAESESLARTAADGFSRHVFWWTNIGLKTKVFVLFFVIFYDFFVESCLNK